jgi:hypothetical protein
VTSCSDTSKDEITKLPLQQLVSLYPDVTPLPSFMGWFRREALMGPPGLVCGPLMKTGCPKVRMLSARRTWPTSHAAKHRLCTGDDPTSST